MLPKDNPLLDFSGLPRYPEINHQAATIGMMDAVTDSRENFEKLMVEFGTPPTWENYVHPLLREHEKVHRVWRVIDHIHNVKDLRDDVGSYYDETFLQYEEYNARFWTTPMVFGRLKLLIKDENTYNNLKPQQKTVVDHLKRDFELNGAKLEHGKFFEYASFRVQLIRRIARFSDNLQHCNDDYALILQDESRLEGIPEDVVEAMKQPTGDEAHPFRYKLTLHAPCYNAVMRFAEDPQVRQTLYSAYATRASDTGRLYGHSENPTGIDENGSYIRGILEYRRKLAHLIGFSTVAEQILATHMLKTTDEVTAFLRDLAARARPYAEAEYAEMLAYANETLEMDSLEAWDLAFVSEKMRQSKFGVNGQDVRAYFQLEKTLDGMFALAKTLFGIDVEISSVNPPTLHKTVRFYDVKQDGQLLGQFYFDPYARLYKHGGAWMDEVISRQINPDGSIRRPVAHLVCNFAEPGEDRPTLLSHDELLTLFHEFGHVLHHVLTEIDEHYIAGLNGVEGDAIELPSQFMENFGWEWSVIEPLTSHVETGDPMPKELFDNMVASKNFGAGMRILKQVEFALFDILLHSGFDPDNPEKKTFQDILNAVRKEVAVVPVSKIDRFAQSFSHIFGGGYEASYYGYKWSDILAADAFALFKERAKATGSDVVSPELGRSFRKEILAVGSSRPMSESFEAFRGRQPTIDAYLEACFGDQTLPEPAEGEE